MAATFARHVARITRRANHGLVSSCYQQLNFPKRYLSCSQVLKERFYTKKHEWVSIESGKGTVGISEYAQEQLGDIVFAETPEVGSSLEANDVAGCLESVKAASEVYTPIGGVVLEVNTDLADNPGIINKSPLTDGWLFKLELAKGTSTDGLLNEDAYKKYVGSLAE